MAIRYKTLTQKEYDALGTYETDLIYFVADTGKQYLNGVEYPEDADLSKQVVKDYDIKADLGSDSTLQVNGGAVVTVDAETGKIDPSLVPSVGGAEWGAITGTLADQTDLKTALDGKANISDIKQADWDESDSSAMDYIKGKPDLDTKLNAPYYQGSQGNVLVHNGFNDNNEVKTSWNSGTLVPSAGSDYVGRVLTVTKTGTYTYGGSWEIPKENDYLVITALQADTEARFHYSGKFSSTSMVSPFTFETSTDGINWTKQEIFLTNNESNKTIAVLENAGDKAFLRGVNNVTGTGDTGSYISFSGNKSYKIEGDITCLLDRKNGVKALNGAKFNSLFKYSTAEIYVKLPSTVLDNYCYNSMFSHAGNLKSVEVPWTGSFPTTCTSYWFDGGGSQNTVFKCPSSLDLSTRGVNTVPANFKITYTEVEQTKLFSGDYDDLTDKPDFSVMDESVKTGATVTINPSCTEVAQATVASALTLNVGTVAAGKIAYAEVVLDVATGATVTAGSGLTLVDTPTAGKRNICVVRWADGVAKLYVTLTEDLDESESN